MKCDYGCGQEGKYHFKNDRICCSSNISQCPAIKNKMYKKVICEKCGRTFTKNGLSYHLNFCKGKKFCKNCGVKIHPDRTYCSIKCSNILLKKKQKYCLYCNAPIKSYATYCNNTCKTNYKLNKQIKEWLEGKLDGCSKSGHANYVKKYLLKKHNNKCAVCGWGEINPFTNTTPLEVEHLDGNPYNNLPENVTILCPNCHSLTKTYRGANRGNGRRSYLKKYYIKDDNGKII